ncbi:DEAD/DEAH box helicase [Paracoccus marinus]|uniref:DEAD/DEAH box helicase n=1 Tax=Paracoccus marinus TaxID=288426 RepID=UPI001FE68278|nr:DEAD/DEAH box helicase [Paracoccus marinus]GLS80369.1 DEAD/DEAH box helicase [Paracoccus marinus]
MTEPTLGGMIPAPLAAALAARGYDDLTPVQNAVLAPEAAGRDLLVSAQTGSGKTAAFGLAMAADILNGDALPLPGLPAALVIAPTRELALQVARELAWLYAGAEIATCVGGMDYRTERRALIRGAQIVVGTPGRLRDHIDRGSLDLSFVRACVLDEADEMLDLGFRDDLEFILGAAPADRRTLMFSATVPPAIEKLAQTFQRDALRLVTQGEARQHGDITYRAISVTARDRENAIFNLLRLTEAKTAIVFCKTRANVNHLLARLGNRGFGAVALSGELSQQERTHALQALRGGRARVCVATDVAARGIDLPGLELVIHADLPTNPETLLHRSGRTGRAGAKGVSALIVTPADYKKAQRLLQGAKVSAEWGTPPTADEVRAEDDRRMLDDPALLQGVGDEAEAAAALIERFGAEHVAAAFIRLWREGRPAPEELADPPAAPSDQAPRPRGEFGDAVWFSLSVGHTGRAEARWLLPKICEAGGISRDSIGAIRVRQDETFVQIATADAPRFGQVTELEAGLVMTRMAGEPMLDRPASRTGKPAAKGSGKPWPKKAAERRHPDTDGAPRPERTERPARPARAEQAERPDPAERPARPRTNAQPDDRKGKPARKAGADFAAPDRPKGYKKAGPTEGGPAGTRKPRSATRPATGPTGKPKGKPRKF